MKQIRPLLATDFIPEKSAILDLVDTGTVQTLTSGVRTLYSNDGLLYSYSNSPSVLAFDNTTGIITAGTTVDAAVDIKVSGLMNAASANTRLRVELEIASVTPIPVSDTEIEITRTGVDVKGSLVFPVYNGVNAVADGFRIWLTAINGNVDISSKHMMIRTH